MDRTTAPARTAAVVGAGFAGLLAAAAATSAGYRVTIIERDNLLDTTDPRPGVPQGEQAHVLLRHGREAIESLLPGVDEELLTRGGQSFNTGMIPWLSEWGWMPMQPWSYEIISISRTLLELVVRERVTALPDVELVDETKISGLRRQEERWVLLDHDHPVITAELVIDASGRTSRLPRWLTDLGIEVPEPTIVDARLGYATRRYHGDLPSPTGAAVTATPQVPVGALALPIEDGDWLICAGGYGDWRPGRTPAEFQEYLARLRDPVLADIAAALEPVTEVAIHRQTANRRYAYGTRRDWPTGLLVVGDALCSFNPVYGQGITVAAAQAASLADLLKTHDGTAVSTQRIQRALGRLGDLPWSVATSEDLRMPTSEGERTLGQRVLSLWTTRMIRLAAAGNEPCGRAFGRVYHLMGPPRLLFSPTVVRAVVGSLRRGVPPAGDRPSVLAELSSAGSAQG